MREKVAESGRGKPAESVRKGASGSGRDKNITGRGVEVEGLRDGSMDRRPSESSNGDHRRQQDEGAAAARAVDEGPILEAWDGAEPGDPGPSIAEALPGGNAGLVNEDLPQRKPAGLNANKRAIADDGHFSGNASKRRKRTPLPTTPIAPVTGTDGAIRRSGRSVMPTAKVRAMTEDVLPQFARNRARKKGSSAGSGSGSKTKHTKK